MSSVREVSDCENCSALRNRQLELEARVDHLESQLAMYRALDNVDKVDQSTMYENQTRDVSDMEASTSDDNDEDVSDSEGTVDAQQSSGSDSSDDGSATSMIASKQHRCCWFGCVYTSQRLYNVKRHQKLPQSAKYPHHPPNGNALIANYDGKFTCFFCDNAYDYPQNTRRHMRLKHNYGGPSTQEESGSSSSDN